MNLYRADLHIHTCLSPCGSLDMSPTVIVETALARGLDIIAITDHNTTLQCPEIQSLGAEAGLTVLAGAEVCTREEAHCIALSEVMKPVPLSSNIWRNIYRLFPMIPTVSATRSG